MAFAIARTRNLHILAILKLKAKVPPFGHGFGLFGFSLVPPLAL